MGATLVSGGSEVVRAGRPDEGGKPLALKLGSDDEGIGKLMLYPPRGGSFDGEAEQLAHWLSAQASIAIENERLHRTVKRQAITDELTQLSNRRRFTETLAVEVRRAERFGDPVSLVLADLDDFKQINDRYGHQTGDEVLRRFADVLRENVRDFDLPVRYGGEEFAVLLPETGLDGAEQLARRLQTALLRLRLPEISGDRPPVTASFGVAAFPAARSAEELLSAADGALYRAKAAGKNRVVSAGGTAGAGIDIRRAMRCRICGREFDPRGFQVVVPGFGMGFDRVDCALEASAAGVPLVESPPRSRSPRGRRRLRSQWSPWPAGPLFRQWPRRAPGRPSWSARTSRSWRRGPRPRSISG